MQESKIVELLAISFSTSNHNIIISISSILLFVLFLVLVICFFISKSYIKHYKLTKMEISLGNIGKVEVKPSDKDIQIAYKIWTQLITRKAAIPIDPSQDVIIEVYDSWYCLFTEIRVLISDIPAPLIKKSKSTREIVRIATETLNKGLRPHLTKWQAKFRNWYKNNSGELQRLSPQELQAKYPQYDSLVKDIHKINQQMIEYANELQKMFNN